MTKKIDAKILFFGLSLLLAVMVSACTPGADSPDVNADLGDEATLQVPVLGSEGEGVDEMIVNDDEAIVDDGDKMMDKKDGEAMMDDGDKVMDDGAMMEANVTFAVTGENFSFSQNEIRVKEGDKVKILFTSESGFHDWVVDEFNAATDQVNSGGTTEVTFVANKKGSFEYYCSVGSHRALGMVGTLIVE